MAADYPAAIVTRAATKLNSVTSIATTTLFATITDSATAISLVDASDFPATNFALLIGTELIFCTTRTGNNVTASVRGYDSTTAAAHTAGDAASNVDAAASITQVQDEVIAIETALGVNLANVVLPARTLTAGAGLTGGGTMASDRTFDVVAGDGITVNANDVAVNSTVVRTTGAQSVADKNLVAGSTAIVDGADPTKTIKFQASGATAGADLTIASVAAADRTVTLSDHATSLFIPVFNAALAVTDTPATGEVLTATGTATATWQPAAATGIRVEDEGSTIVAAATGINFAGAGVVVTDAGSNEALVTIAAASGGITWNNVTGTSQTMVAGNAYITNAATLCTATLPSVATTSIGDYLRVQGAGAGGVRIAQVALSQIIWNEGGVDGTNETTIGTGGRMDSTDDRDGVELVCTADDGTNVTWTVCGAKGNWSLT